MKRFVVLDKKVGETPLSAILQWKKEHPIYAGVSACYAGRLDPMASGKLLILLGEECKQQSKYTNLDKEYEIEILLDMGSDTGDALGMPQYSGAESKVDECILQNIFHQELGAHLRPYPIFSSKTVQGKPLFLHALEGSIASVQIPEHLERIYRIQSESTCLISQESLAERISKFLDLVPRTEEVSKRLGADFRVDAIRMQWNSIFNAIPPRNFSVLRLRVVCASGTYMRSLAGRIGESLHTNALALSIRRTKIGKYVPLWKGFGFWVYTK